LSISDTTLTIRIKQRSEDSNHTPVSGGMNAKCLSIIAISIQAGGFAFACHAPPH